MNVKIPQYIVEHGGQRHTGFAGVMIDTSILSMGILDR